MAAAPPFDSTLTQIILLLGLSSRQLLRRSPGTAQPAVPGPLGPHETRVQVVVTAEVAVLAENPIEASAPLVEKRAGAARATHSVGDGSNGGGHRVLAGHHVHLTGQQLSHQSGPAAGHATVGAKQFGQTHSAPYGNGQLGCVNVFTGFFRKFWRLERLRARGAIVAGAPRRENRPCAILFDDSLLYHPLKSVRAVLLQLGKRHRMALTEHFHWGRRHVEESVLHNHCARQHDD
mmetsp:Transcript_31762/g.71217  ORF Transcript_31762/g.71217 Transcript_31762/m.71217 type:complete len:234 (-) Transcript_31762:78-779(-)